MNLSKIFLSISALTVLAFAGTEITQEQKTKLQMDYPELIGKPGITINKGINHGKFTQVELEVKTPKGVQQFEVFVVDGIETVFAGNAYDKTGKKIDLPKNGDLIKKGVAFTSGKGKEPIYLVTDPECPYCQKFEENIDPEVAKKYSINVIPMPLSFHKSATPMFYWILSGKNNAEINKRFHAVMIEKNKEWEKFTPTEAEKAKLDEVIKNGLNAAMELKAGGTPSMFDKDFKQMDLGSLMKKAPTATPKQVPQK